VRAVFVLDAYPYQDATGKAIGPGFFGQGDLFAMFGFQLEREEKRKTRNDPVWICNEWYLGP
jgi:hypothetical protein